MNRFRIASAHAEAFEERWRKRQSKLDEQPGFLRFRFLKAAMGGDAAASEFVSYSEWLDQASFVGWMEGSASREAHANAGATPREAFLGPPEFRGYTVALDEVPGHRTDYRSVALDTKVEKLMAGETPAQREVRLGHLAQGLRAINIGAFEGRMIEILLRSIGARRGVEIGTLGGYSASWIARALPKDGKLTSLELDPASAEKARKNLEAMGYSSQVEIKVGPALETLKTMDSLKDLDFVFIDADKSNYGNYVKWALPRVRKGGLILADNAYIWGGMHYLGLKRSELPSAQAPGRFDFDASAFEGMSECWHQMAAHPEYASIVLPTGEGLGVAIRV